MHSRMSSKQPRVSPSTTIRPANRLGTLPLDVGVFLGGFLLIHELLAIEGTSVHIKAIVCEALKQPRDKAVCCVGTANEMKWLRYALARSPQVKSLRRSLKYYMICYPGTEDPYDFEFTLNLLENKTKYFSHWFRSSACPKFLTTLRVDSLAILHMVPDRRAVFPALETLTVYADTSDLHVEKAKGFLAPEWADVNIRFDHTHGDIDTYVQEFTNPTYILPTATMCINLVQERLGGELLEQGYNLSLYEHIFSAIVDDIGIILKDIPKDLRAVEIALAHDPAGHHFLKSESQSYVREAVVETAVPRVLGAVEEFLKKDFPNVKLREELGRRQPTGIFSLQG